MDTAVLVDELERNAVKLVTFLQDSNFTFTVAALMKKDETEDWYLVLGIPEIRAKGSRNALANIFNIIKENSLDLTLNDITLLDDRDLTFQLLRHRIGTTSKITRIIFTGNYIEGVKFPDSIIYFIK